MELQESVDIKARVSESVIDVFDTMLSLPVEVAGDDSAERENADRVVAAVNFAGEVMGLITFDVSDAFSRIMAAAMLGVQVDEIENDDEIKDLLGEIGNIVGGNLKSAFTDAGLDCSISTPSITAGSGFTIEAFKRKPFERFVFRYEDHRIFVEVGLKPQQGGQDAGQQDAGQTETQGGGSGAPRDFEAIGSMDLKASACASLVEVFDTMLSMEIRIMEQESPPGRFENYLVGSVNFTGEIMGLVSIGVPDPFSRLMAAAMLGTDADEIESDDETRDLLGEISNIVGSRLKSAFTDAGIGCRLSPPAIIAGSDFRIESPGMETTDRLVFGFREHRGIIEIGVKGLRALKEAARSAPTPSPVERPHEPSAAVETQDPITEAPGPAPMLSSGGNLDVILDIPLELTVELGRTRMKLSELLEMNQGSVVELAKLDGEPVDILANEKVIAKGEVTVENEKYGIRITEVLGRLDRIKNLR